MNDKTSFSDLLEQSLESQETFEGKVVKGTIIRVKGDIVIVDVGLKSEGRIPIKEFEAAGVTEIRPGDVVDVFVERLEDRNGEIVLSIEKAKREASWNEFGRTFADGRVIEGMICGRVKGGFSVDLGCATAFLPGSQVDIRSINDISPLLNIKQPFKIIKMDKPRNNIVVSRRLVIEDAMAGARQEVLANLSEGKVVKGIVRNITDYGAFVDLGGIDGLLHATDMSWKRVSHPSSVVSVGQEIEAVVLKFNLETQRISLGIKQLHQNPWEGVEQRYSIGQKYKGTVTNVADYGAFVELEPGIEGLIYVTEMSWLRKTANAHKTVSVGQEVEVMVLDVDSKSRRMSLGLKQCLENPWEQFAKEHAVGSIIEGVVRNATEFGLFVGVTDVLDGMVHMSDIAWKHDDEESMKSFEKGQKINVMVLDVDFMNERISLGIKQIEEGHVASDFPRINKGDIVTCVIKEVNERGLEVLVKDKISAFIKKGDLSDDRYRPADYAVGEKIDAKVVDLSAAGKRLVLSIKAREQDEKKTVLSKYGSSDSGASLGDILGEAIRKKSEKDSETV
ncbi:MAG: 30S ribosomal protein S1 [Holosporales bacterium]|jgi:small subunit ribosomal protein S1|nr:30S ribosomal protein S1 [Holosporales bacterium]